MKTTPITEELVQNVQKLTRLGKSDSFISFALSIPVSAVARAKDGAVSQIIHCEHCGKDIFRLAVRQRWCSEECRLAARELNKKEKPRRHCIVCGNVLEGRKRLFCSAKCKKIKHTSGGL